MIGWRRAGSDAVSLKTVVQVFMLLSSLLERCFLIKSGRGAAVVVVRYKHNVITTVAEKGHQLLLGQWSLALTILTILSLIGYVVFNVLSYQHGIQTASLPEWLFVAFLRLPVITYYSYQGRRQRRVGSLADAPIQRHQTTEGSMVIDQSRRQYRIRVMEIVLFAFLLPVSFRQIQFSKVRSTIEGDKYSIEFFYRLGCPTSSLSTTT